MEGLEKQIRETYEKAFWDLVDQDPPDVEHIGKLLEEIIGILCNFVPSRTDIHTMIREDLASVDWDLQSKLLKWAERFQAPIYDQVTESWRRKLPEKLSVFLKKYYEHLEKINKQIWEERSKLAKGPQLKSGH
jgi:hypothetical protein